MRIFPATIRNGEKIPLITGWQHKATTDTNQHQEWYKQFGQALTLWGIPCGQDNGIVAVDIDVKNGINGFETIKEAQLNLPTTMTQRTLSGGMHLIYKIPQGIKIKNTASKYAKNVDTRGDGGWIAYYGFDSTPIASAPDWLIRGEQADTTKEIASNFSIKPSLAREMLYDICTEVQNAAVGTANNTLNLKAFEAAQNLIGTGSLPKEEVFEQLMIAARARGKSDAESRATIESGFAGGLRAGPSIDCPFEPKPVVNMQPKSDRWFPPEPTMDDFFNFEHLKKKQNHKDWSPRDIYLFTADGGIGKTTLKLQEAICLALGERFLGFECEERGNTLFITGEDSEGKLYNILGKQMLQMNLNNEQKAIVKKSIRIKLADDMMIVTQDKNYNYFPNHTALEKICEGLEEFKPKMIIIDPLANFWGKESDLNDMSRAVTKFAALLRDRADACVVLINHMGKQSSQSKDKSQFAGRGGSALPSHSRIVMSMVRVDKNEFTEMTGRSLPENTSAVETYCSKFSDHSPILNEPQVLLRTGHLFDVVPIIASAKRDKDDRSDVQILIDFMKECKKDNKYPTKDVLIGTLHGTLSKDRITNAMGAMAFKHVDGYMLKTIVHPDINIKKEAYVLIDEAGNEI